MISKLHSNRKLHNWLVYNIGDKFLEKYSKFFVGNLYDFGCGESPYKNYFLTSADTYTSVDWAGSLHDTEADIVSDLNKPIPVESHTADTIVSLSVLEHLCEPQNMLNEAFRILKPGGNLVLQVPWQWLIHEAPNDYFRYTPYGLEYLCEKAGFTDIQVEAQSGFFTTLFLKFNYFSRRLVRGPKLFRLLAFTVLIPIWYMNQLIAPILDKLDGNWALETTGYYLIAKKPDENK